jgi:hypothetical protein
MVKTPELEQELEQSNRYIVDAHARIARQRELIGHLSEARHDVAEAKDLLLTLVDGVEIMQVRRRQIVRELQLPEVRTRT